MPKPTKGARLGGSPAHQKAILSNLATSLFEHGAITTTEAKARRLRPFAERLITKAKRGDLHNRRQVLAVVRDKGVVHTLFTEIGPRYANRPGGYTRITKLGPRHGDNAPMAVIELVQEGFTSRARTTTKAASPAKKAAATPAVEPVESPEAGDEAVGEEQAAEAAPQATADTTDETAEATDGGAEAPDEGAETTDDTADASEEAVAERAGTGDAPEGVENEPANESDERPPAVL